MPIPPIVNALARAFVAGEATAEGMAERGVRMLGGQWPWLRLLSERYGHWHEQGTRPRLRETIAFLQADKGLRRAIRKYGNEIAISGWRTGEPRMQPVPAAVDWPVPTITNSSDLADFLSLYPAELEWFADLKNICHAPRLRHYNYRFLAKRSGGVRLIESPKANLKAVQRRILSTILDQIPPHTAAHGFATGRSIKTFTTPHVGQSVVLRMDLADFFPSVSRPRIQSLFRTAGYPEIVADLLGGLCTTITPREVCGHLLSRDDQDLYRCPHLPQGAPGSPSLANAAAWRMDCRLTGLAESAGATYTRYADDLAFSGGEDFRRSLQRFPTHAAAIVLEEGFRVQHRKTRIMNRGVRQHLAGLVVNEKLNVARDQHDRLKAILTNCVRFGPESQNRESHPLFRSHLDGRIGFVQSINPARGERLRAIFDRVQWTE